MVTLQLLDSKLSKHSIAILLVAINDGVFAIYETGIYIGDRCNSIFDFKYYCIGFDFYLAKKTPGRNGITGYDESKINLLLSTNRIGTIAFLIQAIIAESIIINAVK